MLQRNIHSIKRLNIKPDLIRSWSGNRLIAIPIFFMRNVLRRVQDEVSTHLEKLGLAPGRTSKPIIEELGFKYTSKIKPHSCPLHDDGPLWELELNQITEKLACGQVSRELSLKLKQRQKELDKKVAHYRQHLLQYETCRAAVKQCENELKFNEEVRFVPGLCQHEQ